MAECTHDCSTCKSKCSKESLIAPMNKASKIRRQADPAPRKTERMSEIGAKQVYPPKSFGQKFSEWSD